jgi:hypothetical protein
MKFPIIVGYRHINKDIKAFPEGRGQEFSLPVQRIPNREIVEINTAKSKVDRIPETRIIRSFELVVHVRWGPVTTARRVFRLQIEGRPPTTEGS